MKRLKAINDTKDLGEKLKLAEDGPILSLESLIEKAEFAHEVLEGQSPDYCRNEEAKKVARDYAQRIGMCLARIITRRDTESLSELLDDLETLKKPQPQNYRQKHIRATLIAFAHLAPEGPDAEAVQTSEKTWHWKTSRKKWSVKHILDSMVNSGKVKLIEITAADKLKRQRQSKAREDQIANLKRQIRREARQLGVKLDTTPGPKT